MPGPAIYPAVDKTDQWVSEPQASDGLWTSYHIAAMCLAYTLTGEEHYRRSAREGMEALYLLQNITGIQGLVARSVAAIDEPAALRLRTEKHWRPTDDGKYLWRDDVSSDQITGHYFAFHVYYDHIARHDRAESTASKSNSARSPTISSTTIIKSSTGTGKGPSGAGGTPNCSTKNRATISKAASTR